MKQQLIVFASAIVSIVIAAPSSLRQQNLPDQRPGIDLESYIHLSLCLSVIRQPRQQVAAPLPVTITDTANIPPSSQQVATAPPSPIINAFSPELSPTQETSQTQSAGIDTTTGQFPPSSAQTTIGTSHSHIQLYAYTSRFSIDDNH